MDKGNLYTSYFSKLKDGKGIKISIARRNPKWIKVGEHVTFWLEALAPEEELLDAYKGGLIDWQKYKEEYTYQIGFGEHTQEVWKAMILIKKYLDKGIDVTVYCHEADWEHCHRNILGKLFKPMDYNVSEIGER